MRVDSVLDRTAAVRFAMCGVGWSLAIFGLLRLTWIASHAVLPFTRIQGMAAVRLFGPSPLPIDVTLACSGADALALCLGAVLAYPVRWRTRLKAALGGGALIVGLNTIRIGTLGLVVASPAWFAFGHLYLWPTLLTLAIAAYVFVWMRVADRYEREGQSTWLDSVAGLSPPMRRFATLAAIFLGVFVAASPLFLHSRGVFAVAGMMARAAALLLGAVGVSAEAAGNVMWTARGGFLVTEECIATPLLPIYLAAVCAWSPTRRWLILGVFAAAPLFIALGVARLLVVALPEAIVGAPLFVVHAFYQFLLGAVIVFLAARWRHPGRMAVGYGLVALVAAVLFVSLFGSSYTRLVTALSGLPSGDPQGALGFLPAFQVGLYLAVWIAAFLAAGWKRFAAGVALLGVTQAAGFLVLDRLGGHAGLTALVPEVRGWAIVGPLLIVALVANLAAPRR